MSAGPDPITVFLGATVDPDDPRSVLALPVGAPLTHERLAAAASQRLTLIDRHALSRTPDADDARLAVHLAAAALAQGVGAAAREPIRVTPKPTPVRPRPGGPPALSPHAAARVAHLARLAVAMSGGWGPMALTRLVSLAAAEGIRPQAIPALLAPLTRSAGSGPSPATVLGEPSPTLRLVHLTEPDDAAIVLDRLRPIAAGVAVFAPIAILVVVLAMLLGRAGTHRPPPVADASTVGASGATDAARVMPPVRPADLPAREPSSVGLIARELELAGQLPESQHADAVERATRAARSAAAAWLGLAEPDRAELRVALRAFADRAPLDVIERVRTQAAPQALPDRPTAAAIPREPASHLAMLDVHAELERAGPARAIEELVRTARAAGLVLSGPGGTDAQVPPSWWNGWAQAATALTAPGSAERSLAVAAALDAMMLTGDTDRSPDGAALARVVRLAAWREGSPERAWLLRALTSPRFDAPALSVLTDALAGSSAARGIDATMTLAPSADAAARAALASRIAAIWEMPLPALSPFAQEWGKVALAALSRAESLDLGSVGQAPKAPDAADALADAAALAWLSAARALHRRSEHDGAAAAVERAADTARPDVTAERAQIEPPLTGATSWLAEYRSQTEPAQRVRLLETAGSNHPLSVTDAREVLREAFRGSPREVRAAAAGAAERLAPTPALAQALLDDLDRLPTGPQLIDLVTIVTGRVIAAESAAQLEARVRAALIEHVLVGGSVDRNVVDELARTLSEAVAVEAGRRDTEPAHNAARRMAARLASVGLGAHHPAPAIQADSNPSPAHALAAALRALARAEAAELSARRPEFGGSAESSVRDMERRWSQATHIHAQLAAAARARVELARLDLLEPEP